MLVPYSWREARTLARLGLPVLLAQLAQMGMNFVDTVMAGRCSTNDLAGVAVASSIWLPVTMFAVGCLLALPGMSAQLVGARRPDRASHLLRQGLILAAVLGGVLAGVLWTLSGRLGVFGLDAAMEPVARGYLLALLPGLPAFLGFICLRSLFEGFGRTRPAMFIGLACLLVNVPCNWIFIYGHLGAPALGGVGCGVATSICYWFMFLSMVIYLHLDRDLGRWSLLRRQERGPDTPAVDPAMLRDVVRVGLPNAVAISIECSLFALTALLLAPLGAVVVAGHQITMNYAAIVFCVPVSINMVSTIRVGSNLGAGNRLRARISAWTALLTGTGLAFCSMTLTMAFREEIAGIYTDDPAVLAVTCTLMLLCGCYQVVDTLQSVGAGILRGYNDTRVVSLVCLVSYGVVGLAGGFIIARTDLLAPALGVEGFWLGYIASLLVCAVCYLLRLRWLHGLPMDVIRTMLAH